MKIPLTLKTETLDWMFRQFTNNPFTTIVFGNDQTEYEIVISCDDRIPGQWSMSPKGTDAQNDELALLIQNDVFPPDITSSLQDTYTEALLCLRNRCLSATLGLCGKLIETSLWSAFGKVTGETPDAKHLGLSAVINRLTKSGFHLKKDAIVQQMELIGTHRNKAIHGSVNAPTEDQAKGIMLLTRDVLNQLQQNKTGQQ